MAKAVLTKFLYWTLIFPPFHPVLFGKNGTMYNLHLEVSSYATSVWGRNIYINNCSSSAWEICLFSPIYLGQYGLMDIYLIILITIQYYFFFCSNLNSFSGSCFPVSLWCTSHCELFLKALSFLQTHVVYFLSLS